MSIISDALKKVSEQRRNAARLRDEDLKRIFISDTKRIKSKKTRWSVLSSVGTILIVGFAIAAFLYNAQFSPPAIYSAIPSLRPAPALESPPRVTPAKEAPKRMVSSAPIESVETELLPVFTLNGIIEGGGESLAMINNNILRKGDFFQGAQIIDIAQNSVTLLYQDKEITLRIK
jgi:hypothetical protein